MVTADHKLTYESLTQACPAVREAGPADAIDGLAPAFVASPASPDEAAALMRAAAARGLAVIPRGAGTRLDWGTPPARDTPAGTLVIDTLRMDKVIEHAAGDLVARVQAGARISAVAEMLAAAGQEVALDVPGQSTVGGTVASGLAGPRRLRYGTPRDLLIGITIVRADGTVAHSGGKVVKNVAGYDLGKLLAGSWGTLALITEVTFRLHPLPQARAYVTASFPAAAGAARAVAMAAASPLVPSAVQLARAAAGGPVDVSVLLEGSADGVTARAREMAEAIAGSVAAGPPPWWPGAPHAGDGTLIRVSFWVSALASALEHMEAAARLAGVTPLVRGAAGAGVLDVTLGGEVPPESAARFVGELRQTLHHARGSVVVLAAPSPVRPALGSCGGMTGPLPSLRLMRAVRDQFDPDHRMSPGRFPAEGAT